MNATQYFTLAARLRMRLYAVNASARMHYGVAGAGVLSGGHYAHWPQADKQRSRRLNRAINRATDAGFAARPRYARLAAMRALYHSIQTLEAAR